LSNIGDKSWITQGIKKSCQRERNLYITTKNSDSLMIILYYKSYCSTLKRVIREGKKVYFQNLIETAENKTKTMWNIINTVTRKAVKYKHLPHLFKTNNKEVSIVKSTEAFNNYFLNMAGDLQRQLIMTFHRFHF
jgi:hypothetical protein